MRLTNHIDAYKGYISFNIDNYLGEPVGIIIPLWRIGVSYCVMGGIWMVAMMFNMDYESGDK